MKFSTRKINLILIVESFLLLLGDAGYLYIGIKDNYQMKDIPDLANDCCMAILVIAIILLCLREKSGLLKRISKVFDIIFLPFVLSYSLSNTFNFILEYAKSINYFLNLLELVLYLVFLIPMVLLDQGTIQKAVWRFLAVIIIINSIFPLNLQSAGSFLYSFNKSGLVNAFQLFILAYFLCKCWGFKFAFILKFKRTHNFQFWVLICLLLFACWLPFFTNFIQDAQNWQQALWQWNFSDIDPVSSYYFHGNALLAIFTPAEAGIYEETERFLLMLICLAGLRNKRFRIETAVFLPTLVWSLGHLGNILQSGRTLTNVWQQVVLTFGFGSFLAVLYLYTGQLWLNMLLHFTWDFLVMSTTPLAVAGSGNLLAATDPSGWLQTIIIMFIPLLAAIIMLFGKRKQFMIDNANRLV